ncbi:MAG: citrate/2-methylcitrate synthase, partial [bacterium]|nr:citrate/2-methylcitrate synthase [bacterium]
VYKTGDARVPILKEYMKRLSQEKKDMKYYETCSTIENTMKKAHRLYPLKKYPSFRWWFPNVDFWAAPTYKLMGIPSCLNTAIFAASRISGWCAHWLEAKHELKEKLARPRAEYIGK